MGKYKNAAEAPAKLRELFEESMGQKLEGLGFLGKTEQGHYRYLCNFVELVRIAEVEPIPEDNLVRIRYSSVFAGVEL